MPKTLVSLVAILLLHQGALAEFRLGGPTAPDGTEVQIDLPSGSGQRIKNIGSHRDGAGMCVMSSIEMTARWANLEQLRGLRDWCANQPGGAYPSKVDRQLKEFCGAKQIPLPEYIQYEGRDTAILKLALQTGRMVSVTYSGRDGVRYRGSIAHMVNLVLLDDKHAAILDNNGIGEDELIWMSPAEFTDRWYNGSGGGWAVIFTAPGPMPVPRPLAAAHSPWKGPSEPQPNPASQPLGPDYGLEFDQLFGPQGYTYYSCQGWGITEEEAVLMLGAAIPDDRSLLRLTVIGPPADTEAVVRDLAQHPLLATVKGRLVLQVYRPDSWALRVGVVTTGKPTIYLQDAAGRVLHRQDDYSGPEALATALRRASPDYDPTKDPDRRLAPLPLIGEGDWQTLAVVGCGGACVGALLLRLLPLLGPVLLAIFQRRASTDPQLSKLLEEILKRLPPAPAPQLPQTPPEEPRR